MDLVMPLPAKRTISGLLQGRRKVRASEAEFHRFYHPHSPSVRLLGRLQQSATNWCA